MKPYVYKLTNSNGEFYYGCRWNYDGEPKNDLLINYFTSSKLIHELISLNGIDYFIGEIIATTDNPKECLEIEYNLIKESFDNPKCLNRAMGKCTIWDDELKKKVSKSVKKLWDDSDYRNNQSIIRSGHKNHNYKKPPWRNVNGDKKNWYKSIKIYEDFKSEKWDFTVYGMGRKYLMERYDISQGMSRKLIELFKNNWNPLTDKDFMDYYNGRVMESVDMFDLKSNGQ